MKRKGRVLKAFAIALCSVFSIVVIFFGGLYIFAKTGINYEADELMIEKSLKWEPTKFYASASPFYDTAGKVGYTEIKRESGFKKAYYPKSELSNYLTEGIVAVEDHRFYQHRGFDVKRTAKAALNYILGGERVFGGSTITQQLIKNVSGDNQLTVSRKLAEILRAVHVEKLYSKDEILEVYLNVIPMGGNIFGVGMAATEYFGKSPDELLPEEAATLIGITNAPTAYNPYSNPDKCIKKRNTVLGVMLEHNVIDREEYERAVAAPLTVVPKSEKEKSFDGWYIETVIEDVSASLAEKYSMSRSAARLLLLRGGYSVFTNMDVGVQEKLEHYFSEIGNFPAEVANGLNYAMAITDSTDGRLLGIVGRVGEKQGNRLLNHALVPHTPASALKPIALYAPLIDEGLINFATVIDDAPISFVGDSQMRVGYPKNSPDVYAGLITVKDAIRLSKNTVAAKLCKRVGARQVFDGLRTRFEFKDLIENETRGNKKYTDVALSPMALGQLTDGISLRELTAAFGSFPSDGIYQKPISFSKVIDPDGRVVLKNENEGRRVFSKECARIMNMLLSEVTADGTAKQITLKEHLECAGKTGTSSGNKDKLFIGYTPYLTAGIWCGYDLSDRGVYSLSKTHLEIWDEIMLDLHGAMLGGACEEKHFSTDGLIYSEYCKDSGEHPSNACELDPRGCRTEFGYFTADNMPTKECSRHVLCDYDTVSKGIAHPSCPREYIAKVALLNVPERAFSRQVEILDAEFVCRELGREFIMTDDVCLPYFYSEIPEGVFVGISGKRKQFNSAGRAY